MKHLYYNVSFNESKKVGILSKPKDWQISSRLRDLVSR